MKHKSNRELRGEECDDQESWERLESVVVSGGEWGLSLRSFASFQECNIIVNSRILCLFQIHKMKDFDL